MSLESRSTTTITTDAYFSADEGESNSSNSDSLTLKTARSTMQATSIVSDDTFKSIQSMTTSSAEPTGLTEKVSMSQTMLNKSRVSLRSTCSAPPVNNRQKASNGDTQSISSSSFVSALSSQEDLDLGALVDLRNQMEKPIVDSQLLMSCYSNHLSRFKCKNWSLLDYDVQNDGRVLLKRSKWTSKFVKTSSTGLSYLKLTKKPTFIDGISDFGSLVQSKYRINDSYCPGCVFVKLKPENTHDDNKKEDESLKVKKQDDGEITKTFELRSEKVTVLIKLDQEIDIKISPLSLDGLRCFIDELIPTLTSLHPLTILNHLNVMCINRVEVNNQLKKEKTLQLGQFKLKAWRTTLERERNLQKNVNKLKFGENLAVSGDQNNLNKTQSAVTANQYEETKVTRIQAFLQMSKINIIVLQASLVEEMIASTALDNIKDITCVSLLAASINNIDFEFCNSKKEKRSLHTFVNTNPVRTPPTSAFASFAQHELVSRLFSKKPKKEHKEIEPLTIETHELLSQETMAVGKVGSFHAQLSRLTNSSSILRDAILTVIPHTQSKVNFEYTRSSFSVVQTPTVRRRSFQNKSTFRRQEGVEKEFDNVYIDTSCDKSSESDESQTDFIMFECGLEEISVQAVKNKNDSDKRVVSEQEKHKENTERKGASFVCGVGVVWFNFAAPPKTPITRKIDFTKLDWHLLSTATPSINAWLTVGERFIVTAKKMNHLSDQRISSIVASLMTCALEVQGIHIPPQSKHLSRKVTPFGKALQEDPSCQLMAVLRRYLKQVKSMDEIEENLTPAFLPSLSDLKRGVVALSRQWKNALYMPLLVEQNIKLNRGDKGVYQIGIPLKLLLGETVKPKEEIQVEFPLSPDTQEETENDDEHTILLPNQSKDYEKGSRLETQVTSEKKRKMSLSSSFPEGLNKASAKTVEDGGMCNGSAVKKTLPKSSRGSIAFPLLSNPLESLGSGVNKAYGFLFNANSQNSALKGKRQESQQSLKSSSSSSIGVGNNMSRDFFTSRNNESAEYHDENLYIWMLRQQEFVEARNRSSLRRISHSKNLDYDTRCNTLGSANSDDENMLSGEKLSSGKDVPPGFAFLPTSVQLADVRVIFTPLFTSLDIDLLPDEPESNLAFDQLGPKVSFCGCVKLFRVDIVECDREEAYSSRSRSPSTIDKLPGLPLKSTVQFLQRLI
ncbi:uncharacterized protein B4U80_01572 [Leptotrombidium deliense]|uniref:Bridge-like lipid transfer protein family member 1 middle region domain-containing protein n=1 Tax=Leptotrombidium deliense TaxID=299467 RepID=A0A443S7V6_9ACAR|nr:uncharacterized protein B4U80_01572 [Leptotrombidium deliense]